MNTTILRASIDEIIYENSNGWSVLRVHCREGSVHAVGTLGKFKKGETWSFSGDWEEHPSFGKQFKINTGHPVSPQNVDEVVALLSGDLFDGIGPATASKLIKGYGKDLWSILRNNPTQILSDGFITENKAKLIIEASKGLQKQWEIMQFLVENDLPIRISEPLMMLYSFDVITKIKDNPYRLLAFSDWKTVDLIAQKLGFPYEDSRRLEAALIYTLQKSMTKGHTAIRRETLLNATSKLISVSEELLIEVLNPPLVCFVSNELIQLPGISSQEKTIAQVISNLLSSSTPLVEREWVEKWINNYESMKSISLDNDQREAVHEAVRSRLLILTGGPGTGKSSVIDAIRMILRDLGQNVLLTAPTGRAARRIQEITQTETKTLHRTFGYTQTNFMFSNTDLGASTLIVDESSMVDLRLWSVIATSVKEQTRLVLVGDPDQLPPVGIGQVFFDIIEKSNLPVVRLTKIHRQASDNPIPYVSKAIREGTIPTLDRWKGQQKGVFFIPTNDQEKAAKMAVHLATSLLPREGIMLEEVQLLCPQKQGATGTKNINSLILKQLDNKGFNNRNPFTPGNRIIQTVNNYELGQGGIMNGSIGTVVACIDSGLIVDFDGEEVFVASYQLSDLEHAYGITIHKSQGSQYKAILIPLCNTPYPLLNRQLIYTAITRATDLVIIVGVQELLKQAIQTNSNNQRQTAFRFHLQEALKK